MTSKKLQFTGPARALIGALALVVLAAIGTPQAAQASTAENTKITNTVTVNYNNTADVAQTAVKASVVVTVSLVVVTPDLNSPNNKSTAYGTAASYDTYTLTSNSNGSATYNLSASVDAQSGISGSSAGVSVPSLTLGGTTLAAAVAESDTTITVPYDNSDDADVNGIVPGDKIEIGGEIYTVAAGGISNNTTTNLTTITLTGAITAVAAAAASVGDVVGEQGTFTLTVTPGTDSAATDGATIDVTVSAVDSLGLAGADTDLTQTTVNVTDATLSVTKEVSKDATNFFLTAGNLEAAPGNTLTYRITVTNGSSDMNVKSVVVTDPEPQFTTYVADSAKVGTTGDAYGAGTALGDTVADAPGPADGYDFGGTTSGEVTYNIGTMAPGAVVILYYQVKID